MLWGGGGGGGGVGVLEVLRTSTGTIFEGSNILSILRVLGSVFGVLGATLPIIYEDKKTIYQVYIYMIPKSSSKLRHNIEVLSGGRGRVGYWRYCK